MIMGDQQTKMPMDNVSDEECRAVLASLLADANEELPRLQELSKKMDNVKTLVYLKRDQAKSHIKSAFEKTVEQVRKIEQQLTAEVDIVTMQKESHLLAEKNKIMYKLQMLTDEVQKTQDILEVGKESELRLHYSSTCGHLEKLLKADSMCSVDSLPELDFIPCVPKTVLSKQKFGYIKSCVLDPLEFALLDPQSYKKAIVGVEESVKVISNIFNQRYVKDGLKCINVFVEDNRGNQLENVKVTDNENGIYTITYTPASAGVYLLYVQVYNQDIPCSPFCFEVLESESDTESTSNEPALSMEPRRKKRIPPSSLMMISEHLGGLSMCQRTQTRVRNVALSPFLPGTGGTGEEEEKPESEKMELGSDSEVKKDGVSASGDGLEYKGQENVRGNVKSASLEGHKFGEIKDDIKEDKLPKGAHNPQDKSTSSDGKSQQREGSSHLLSIEAVQKQQRCVTGNMVKVGKDRTIQGKEDVQCMDLDTKANNVKTNVDKHRATSLISPKGITKPSLRRPLKSLSSLPLPKEKHVASPKESERQVSADHANMCSPREEPSAMEMPVERGNASSDSSMASEVDFTVVKDGAKKTPKKDDQNSSPDNNQGSGGQNRNRVFFKTSPGGDWMYGNASGTGSVKQSDLPKLSPVHPVTRNSLDMSRGSHDTSLAEHTQPNQENARRVRSLTSTPAVKNVSVNSSVVEVIEIKDIPTIDLTEDEVREVVLEVIGEATSVDRSSTEWQVLDELSDNEVEEVGASIGCNTHTEIEEFIVIDEDGMISDSSESQHTRQQSCVVRPRVMQIISPHTDSLISRHSQICPGRDVKGSLVGCAGYNMPGVCESLRFPIGVTTKANKDLVVCSTGTHCVKVFANYSVPTLIIGCSAKMELRVGHMGCGDGELLHFPIGIVTGKNQDIIVCDNGNSMLKVFSRYGLHKKTIDDGTFRRPSAVVVNKDGDIFVKDDRKIQVFTAEGQFQREFGQKVLKRPYGLVLNKFGQLMTLDQHRDGCMLHIFAQEGTLIQSYPFFPVDGPVRSERSKCRFMAVNDHFLIVSDLGKCVVYLTTFDGRLKRQIGGFGTGCGQFIEPSGVTTDSNGNIIIADSKNHRIQVFHPNGDFMCMVELNDRIQRPSDIHLMDDDHLFITDFLRHCVKVYKLGDQIS